MKKIFTVIAIAIAANSFSQVSITPAPKTTDDKVYTVAEVMPVFPGGNNNLAGYLQKNLQYKRPDGITTSQGPCLINFIVEKDGSITNAKVVRGVPADPAFDKECLRLISTMPPFTSGKDKGQPVRVSMNWPISYPAQK